MIDIKSDIHIEYNKVITDVLAAFIKICLKHDLRYFCCGGTAIGAVRHNGIIPWDDDIDILMPRPDFDKFIELFKQNKNDRYHLITAELDDMYYLPFAKMSDAQTTLIENKDILCNIGAFIDIFPLDGAPSSDESILQHLNLFRKAANKLRVLPKSRLTNWQSCLKMLKSLYLRTAYNEIRYSFNKKNARQKILKELDAIMRKYSYEDSNTVGNYGGMWGRKEFGPKEWFQGYIEFPFEGLEVRLPKGYHLLLTQMYGDYMQLPPVEKRITHHHRAYLNLNERKPPNEVIYELKRKK